MPVTHNLRQVIRVHRNAPGFTIAVVLIVALGIAANTAVFTLVNSALLRPLPYRDPSSLVFVSAADRGDAEGSGCLSYPHFSLVAGRSRGFEDIAGFTSENFNFTTGDEAVQLQAARVSSNFFRVLGINMAMGRGFTSDADKPGGRLVAVLSDAFWRRRLSGNPEIIGKPITLDAKSYTVVGVLPPWFRFASLGNETEVWTTHIDELNLMSPQQIQAGACYLAAVARLAPGSSIGASQAEMDVLNRQYLREYPKLADADPKRPVQVTPLRTKFVNSFRSMFLILSASVGIVLLIACANVAGLLLARGLKRRREIAIRMAMGASRKQVITQLLTESVVLALLSGMLGLALGVAGTHALAHFAAKQIGPASGLETTVDWRIAVFAVGVSIATGLLFGLAPALQFSRADVGAALREEGRGTAGARTKNLSCNLLAGGQIALSLVLLVAAGLLIRSFIRLQRQPPGFEPSGVLTMNLTLPPAKYYTPAQMIEFYDRLLERVESVAGVRAAAVSSALPVNVARLTPVLIEGQAPVPLAERPILIIQTFTPSYLRIMQIPLIRGRFFSAFDKHDSARVIIVNQSFVNRYFPRQDPIGKHVWLGRMTTPAQIVGVIGDIKNVSLSAGAQPEIDIPFAQLPWGRMNLLVRASTGDPKGLTDAIRLQIAKIDRDQPATAIKTMDELLTDASSQPRVIMALLTAFAGFAFMLAIVGLYSVLSYSVAQRRQEMGVRMALGATRRDVLTLVLRQGAVLAVAGIVAGVGCALAVTRLMDNLVYGVRTIDPFTFVLVPALFLASALTATCIPALRATQVDVAEVLKEE
ncbi:MAG: ABC transporter permease [Acidobacteriaceae bacterium]|nr:ABC transporter permease [Acidobacteriaceae bacterium]